MSSSFLKITRNLRVVAQTSCSRLCCSKFVRSGIPPTKTSFGCITNTINSCGGIFNLILCSSCQFLDKLPMFLDVMSLVHDDGWVHVTDWLMQETTFSTSSSTALAIAIQQVILCPLCSSPSSSWSFSAAAAMAKAIRCQNLWGFLKHGPATTCHKQNL